LEKLFRQDGACRRGEGRHRLQAWLHAAVCQQGCRYGSASEELTISVVPRGQRMCEKSAIDPSDILQARAIAYLFAERSPARRLDNRRAARRRKGFCERRASARSP